MIRNVVVILLLIFFSAFGKKENLSEEAIVLQKDIALYNEKLELLTEKIKANREEALLEQRSFETYNKSFERELSYDQKELKSLKKEYTGLKKSSDSLSRVIASRQYRVKEYRLKQKRFIKGLVATVSKYIDVLSELPTPIFKKEKSALTFLKNEIEAGSVGGSEGVERLWQVSQTLADNRTSVDIWNGSSTCEFIEGQVHYIRVGYAWLACVNDDASKAALWKFEGEESGWTPIESLAAMKAIRQAIKIRNGNSVPEIISLPILYTAHLEDTNEK